MRSVSQVGALSCVLLGLCFAPTAYAQSTIRHPGQHPHYAFEAEPHLLLGPFDPPGWPRGDGWGVGFRGTVELASNAFIKTINNSVGISFGVDWVHYPHSYLGGVCTRWVGGPNGTTVCTEINGGSGRDFFYLPVAMQWNFWLARQWSVFAEPGILPYLHHGELNFEPIAMYAGGRFHFSDRVSLTLRLGYPTLSLGASFFL
jgi:hypothetical protein